MRFLLIAFLLCISSFIKAEDTWPDRDSLNNIYTAAVLGEPNSQLLMGLLCELGYGVSQNFEEAAGWYLLAAHNENERALRRLGILMFLGEGVPKDETLGMLLILLGPQDGFLENFTSEQQAMIESLRCLWNEIQSESRQPSLLAQNYGHQRKRSPSSRQQIPLMLTSDRWEPADDNRRIYGPGTGDWNKGILRSDYERIERDSQDLIAKINAFKNGADEKKAKDLREQIERMQAESNELKSTALKELIFAVGNALAAGGLMLEMPPLALFEGFRAIEGFKESAGQYVEAINIGKDAQRLLDIERSLERARSFGGRE